MENFHKAAIQAILKGQTINDKAVSGLRAVNLLVDGTENIFFMAGKPSSWPRPWF
jgi:hypothetical protein